MLTKTLAGAVALAALIAAGPVFAQSAPAPAPSTTTAAPAAATTATKPAPKPRARRPSLRSQSLTLLKNAGYTKVTGLKRVTGGTSYTATATKDGKTGTVTVDPKTGTIQ